MRIDVVRRLVIHQLRPLGLGQQSDRRGPVCDLVLADIPNTEHAANIATRILQRVCSLLDESYFWSDNRDKGPSEFTEQFEAWIDASCFDGNTVHIRHKYWSEERVDGFLEIMLTLARLHRWEVEDRRGVDDDKEAEEEAGEFMVSIASWRPDAGEDAVEAAWSDYMERAASGNTCPWRLLVRDMLNPDAKAEAQRPGFGPEIPGAEQVKPGIYVAKDVESINTGKVIPFPRKGDGR